MPGMYEGEDYDIAGFCIGVVEASEIIDGSKVSAGDALIALASSGPHSNGFSLIRKILEVSKADLTQPVGDKSLADALLEPTRIYVKPVLKLIEACDIHALSHITGGGFWKISRACCQKTPKPWITGAIGNGRQYLAGCKKTATLIPTRCIVPSTAA